MSTATSSPPQPLRRAKSTGALGHVDNGSLFVAWQQGADRHARDELVQRFLPLARKLARRYSGAREPFDDLLQVASLGLVKAIDRFDLSRGTAFSSFAVPTILGELKRYFRDLGWAVHVPRGAQERAVKVEEAQQLLSGRLNRAPTVPELAEYLEFSIEDVLDALETSRAHHASSLDAPYDDGEGESGTMVESFGRRRPQSAVRRRPDHDRHRRSPASHAGARGPDAAVRPRPHADADRRSHRCLADAGQPHPAAGASRI